MPAFYYITNIGNISKILTGESMEITLAISIAEIRISVKALDIQLKGDIK